MAGALTNGAACVIPDGEYVVATVPEKEYSAQDIDKPKCPPNPHQSSAPSVERKTRQVAHSAASAAHNSGLLGRSNQEQQGRPSA